MEWVKLSGGTWLPPALILTKTAKVLFLIRRTESTFCKYSKHFYISRSSNLNSEIFHLFRGANPGGLVKMPEKLMKKKWKKIPPTQNFNFCYTCINNLWCKQNNSMFKRRRVQFWLFIDKYSTLCWLKLSLLQSISG